MNMQNLITAFTKLLSKVNLEQKQEEVKTDPLKISKQPIGGEIEVGGTIAASTTAPVCVDASSVTFSPSSSQPSYPKNAVP